MSCDLGDYFPSNKKLPQALRPKWSMQTIPNIRELSLISKSHDVIDQMA